MWTVELPLIVPVSKSSKFSLNLNEYRNAHYQTLNKAKVVFKEMVTPLLKDLPKMQQVTLQYTLFPGSARLCDVSNICSVVDKFFSDALVENGHIDDDNYTVVTDVRYKAGSIDRANPRVEVLIEPIGEQFPTHNDEKEDDSMQITLVQFEIEQAITNYILEQVTVKEGMQIKIDLSATRGAEGFKATIDIVPQDFVGSGVSGGTEEAASQPKVNARVEPKEETRSAPKASAAVSKPEPKVETKAVAQPEPEVEEAAAVEDTPFKGDEAEAAEEEQAEAPKETKPASLFAGLTRPRNN